MFYQLWMSNASSRSEKAIAQQIEAEREAEAQALIAAHVESGARPLILCESGWADEQHPYWGVTAFPELESRIKLYRLMNEFGYYQRNEPSFTLLGTAWKGPNPEYIQPGRIYMAWMVRTDPAAYLAFKARSLEENQQMFQDAASAMDRYGGCVILDCTCFWANDAFYHWGFETFPSLEAIQGYKEELDKLDWPSYIPVTSILGTLHPWQQQFATIFR